AAGLGQRPGGNDEYPTRPNAVQFFLQRLPIRLTEVDSLLCVIQMHTRAHVLAPHVPMKFSTRRLNADGASSFRICPQPGRNSRRHPEIAALILAACPASGVTRSRSPTSTIAGARTSEASAMPSVSTSMLIAAAYPAAVGTSRNSSNRCEA